MRINTFLMYLLNCVIMLEGRDMHEKKCDECI